MRRIGLVSCGKRKQRTSAPARDLYTSALFRESRAWAEANCDAWYILSAQHGLLDPATHTAPYERTLNTLTAPERLRWAQRVYRQLHAAGLLHSGVEFVWLAGRRYQEHLSRSLVDYVQTDPLQGLGIGRRLRWLKEHLGMRDVSPR